MCTATLIATSEVSLTIAVEPLSDKVLRGDLPGGIIGYVFERAQHFHLLIEN